MSRDPGERHQRVTQSWRYWQSKAGGKPESTGGLIALYVAVLAAIAVYSVFH